ncbi:MAG: hypothetical protein CSA72_00075 [Rhodobacterales bacterium]|nr:MAG: hypothetical protein CR993_00360 [Rhodobacterales bacterium]PIE12692.1 MAG: hypothetical protein CSA72_00075 [Rhodobacterales bacterium]
MRGDAMAINQDSDLIFIFGRQRSGTTVFRELLAQNGALNCDEILHGDLSRPFRFYQFVAEAAARDPALIHPQHHAALFRRYIEALRAEHGGKLAMDVKYFALNLIPGGLGGGPFLIDYAAAQRAHVVLILRRNKLRMIVSERLAQATGRWSADRPERLLAKKPKVELAPERIVAEIEALQRMDRVVLEMLGKTPWAEVLYYDEMFAANGDFSKQVQGVARKVLGRGGDFRRPRNLKMNPEALSDLIAAPEEIAAALRDTAHGWMLEGGG